MDWRMDACVLQALFWKSLKALAPLLLLPPAFESLFGYLWVALRDDPHSHFGGHFFVALIILEFWASLGEQRRHKTRSNGRVFIQSWRSDYPALSRQFRVSLRTIFSAVDTQTAVLISTAKVWISALDTQTSAFLGCLGIHRCFWFFCPGATFSLRRLSPNLGIQHQLRIKTPTVNKDVGSYGVFAEQLSELRQSRNAILGLKQYKE